MTAAHAMTVDTSKFALPPSTVSAAQRRSASDEGPRLRAVRGNLPNDEWQRRSEKWGALMAQAQRGKRQVYEHLLRELDHWLRRYYARRLPPAVADDARQDALLAIHTKRHKYSPSRPFGPWVAAIARYKWIDHVRDVSRRATLSLDDEMPIEHGGEAALSAVAVDDLLSLLKPAQAQVIRLVKLDGASIEDASSATGQSASLVKVNIHRGLKKLAAIAAEEASMPGGRCR
jgi:RNA polymerase sigma factor (sigma-70 family)